MAKTPHVKNLVRRVSMAATIGEVFKALDISPVSPEAACAEVVWEALLYDQMKLSLQTKFASLIIHIEEGDGIDGHPFDWAAIRSILSDPEVKGFLKSMEKRGLLPVKRS